MNVENELEKIERILNLTENIKYEGHYIDNFSVCIDKNDKTNYVAFVIYDTDGDDIMRCAHYEDFIVKFIQYIVQEYYSTGRRDLQRQLKVLLGD